MPATLFVIGVIMAAAGNALIACALTLQKHVHNKMAGKPASRSPLFWLSLVGMVAGEVGNFAAFGFARWLPGGRSGLQRKMGPQRALSRSRCLMPTYGPRLEAWEPKMATQGGRSQSSCLNEHR